MPKKKRIQYILVNFILATFVYSILLLESIIFGGGFGAPSHKEEVQGILIMVIFFPLIAIGYFFMIKNAGENRRAFLKIMGLAFSISPFLLPLSVQIYFPILDFVGLI